MRRAFPLVAVMSLLLALPSSVATGQAAGVRSGVEAAPNAPDVASVPTQINLPGPVLTLSPVCDAPAIGGGPARWSIAVHGQNFSRRVDARVTFDPSGAIEDFAVLTDDNGAINATITPLRRGEGTYQVRAFDLRRRTATALFFVPCPTFPPPPPTTNTVTPTVTPTIPPGTLTPTLTPEIPGATTPSIPGFVAQPPPELILEPPFGPPGFVTGAIGRFFPPNTAVTLTWDIGLGAKVVMTDGGGTFSEPILIFRRDSFIGSRLLIASGPGFNDVSAAFFVVVPTLQRNTLAPGQEFVSRL